MPQHDYIGSDPRSTKSGGNNDKPPGTLPGALMGMKTVSYLAIASARPIALLHEDALVGRPISASETAS